jgi:hypothetical protein
VLAWGRGIDPTRRQVKRSVDLFNTYSLNSLIFFDHYFLYASWWVLQILAALLFLLASMILIDYSHWKPPLRVGLKRKCLLNFLKIAKFRFRENFHFRNNTWESFAKMRKRKFSFKPYLRGFASFRIPPMMWLLSVCRFWLCSFCKSSQMPAQWQKQLLYYKYCIMYVCNTYPMGSQRKFREKKNYSQ